MNSPTGSNPANNKMHAHNHNIKCSVDTCYYYDNNYCSADTINICPQGDGVAQSADGTSCSTFTKSMQ